MVYQQFINYPSLTVYENIASPLRVAGPAARGDRPARAGSRQAAAARALSGSHAAAALRRPAAAHRDRARAGQGRRSRAARRAARQSRLQAARGTARGTAAHLRSLRRDLRLRDDRAFRGAAARRQHRSACGKAGRCRPATPQRSIASPTRCAWRRCSPIRRSTSSASRRRTARCSYAGGVEAPATGLYAELADGPYRVGFRAHQLEVANGVAGRHRVPRHRHGDGDHRLGKLRASRTATPPTGSRCCRACTNTSPARRSMPRSIPTTSSCSTRPAGWSPRRRLPS